MLDEKRILNIIANELSNSAGGDQENGYIASNQKAALATYLGQPDGTETEGKSTVVSTDVADAIEWILPEVIKAFTQNNDVVTFDPTFAGDERQAEIESQYVYDVLMKDNNGFIILHEFFKDALMQKNGFLKAYYEKDEEVSEESYTGLTEPELLMMQSEAGMEIIGMDIDESGQIPTYNVNVKVTRDCSKQRIISVAPENFRVNRMHNSVDLSTARFTAHMMLKTISELKEEGLDTEELMRMVNIDDDNSNYRFYMQGETVTPTRDDSVDPSQYIVEIAECCMMIDIEETGIAKQMKITVAGGDSPYQVLEMEEIGENPFISSTAILMSHKLYGLSIYDRLRQIQEQKTTLWRNMFDNMYLQNNQRTVAVEGQVNLDDLLISRPGGIIRAKRLDAVQPYTTPPLSGDAYKMMDYLDQVRKGRAGVSPEGAIQDSAIGDRVGSQGVERMMSQTEELVGLMIRVFAETGIKPLCYKIRRSLIKHQDLAKDYKFRGDWVQVKPSSWRDRPNSTVRVGTGSGNKKEQIGAIGQIMAIQEKLMQNPSNSLVGEEQIFKAVDKFAKFSGMPGVTPYLLDPASPEGKQKAKQVQEQNSKKQQQEMKEQQMMLEAQTKIANAEESKAQTAQQNVQLKAQVDQGKNQLEAYKAKTSNELSMLEQQLNEAEALIGTDEKTEELAFRYWEAKERFDVEYARIKATKEAKSGQGSKDSDS